MSMRLHSVLAVAARRATATASSTRLAGIPASQSFRFQAGRTFTTFSTKPSAAAPQAAVRTGAGETKAAFAAATQAAGSTVVPPPAGSIASTSADALSALSDDVIMGMLHRGELSVYRLESALGDCTRAVSLRRRLLIDQLEGSPEERRPTTTARTALRDLPYTSFNEEAFYRNVLGANAECVVGYVPLPVGVAGPLRLDGRDFQIPLATTEGALIASANRGCRAITMSGGATSVVTADGMSRAPVLLMPSLAEAGRLRAWVADPANAKRLADAFESTTRFGKVRSATVSLAGRNAYLRFQCFTGDAMGMNMITKGVNEALKVVAAEFPGMLVKGLSGNMCTDKKPSAINWVNGRGKSVVVEAVIKRDVLRRVLKTDVEPMIQLNTSKNLVGSAMAGSVGGFNAHASNLVTAVYLATGQDAAQNVESSNCITLMEKSGDDLLISVTMPSVEVGTVGGGTTLPAQAACLELLGVRGASKTNPGENAANLARVVAASVLAGELSLMAALTSNDLLSSHLELNRKPTATPTEAPAVNGHVSAKPAGTPPKSMSVSTHARASAGVAYPSVPKPAAFAAVTAPSGRRFFAEPALSPEEAVRHSVVGGDPMLSTP